MGERGIDRAVVCGLSMGGYVAFELWRRARDRVPGSSWRTRGPAPTAPRPPPAAARSPSGCGSEGNVLVAEPPPLLSDHAPEELRTRVHGWIADQPPEAIAAAALGMAERPDSTPDLATIDVPTLVLTSTEDRLIPPQISRRDGRTDPAARRLEMIDGAGHLSNLEAPRRSTRRCSTHLAACGLG